MKTSTWIVLSAALTSAVACSSDGTSSNQDDGGAGGDPSGSGGSNSGSGGKASGGKDGAGTGGGSAAGGAPGAGGTPGAGRSTDVDGGSGGTDGDSGTADASDSSTGSGGTEGGTSPEAGSDSGAPLAPVPYISTLSNSGHDRFYGATYDAAGNLYVTGQIAAGIDAAADFSLMVVKFTPAGVVDTTFGNDGVAVKNVAPGGTSREIARGIVIQSDGKIVIAGSAEHDPKAAGLLANDTDIVFVRFLATGAIDESFGTKGVFTVDLNSGVIVTPPATATNPNPQPQMSAGDTQWGLSLLDGDKLVTHANQRGTGVKTGTSDPRTDTDWALVKIKKDGGLDDTFGGGDGIVTLDIAEGNASPRATTVLADGSIVAAGYTTTSVLGTSSQQPVLYKVTAAGVFDDTFATEDAYDADGVFHDYTAPKGAEAYGAVLAGGRFVTLGYGPTPGTGTATDLISLRFSTAGVRETTGYGKAGDLGVSYVDVGGYGENGRGLVALPSGKVIGFGSGRAAPNPPLPVGETPPADALVIRFGTDGLPDETFAPGGYRLYNMGGTADTFWGGAVSPDKHTVAVVGIAGAVSATKDDDGAILFVPTGE